MADWFLDYTVRTVILGSTILGIVSGSLGSFAFLRRQSLLGDAMSHAALPGIVLAFLITRSKAPIVLLLGASAAGWLAALIILGLLRKMPSRQDGALSFVLSTFFGAGLMLLTYTQRLPDARQAGLDRFLFGQAATILREDIITMGAFGGFALLVMLLFWKEFKLLTFDREFAAVSGLPVSLLDGIMTTLLVIAIIIGLQSVGVVLMSALVVAPVAAARQWTSRFGVMITLAGMFGGLAGIAGTVVSSAVQNLATGPTIVLTASLFVAVSMAFAPHRGLIWRWAVERRRQRAMAGDRVLNDLYLLASQHLDVTHPHHFSVLGAMSLAPSQVKSTLLALQKQGLVSEAQPGAWSLTPAGVAQAGSRHSGENA